MLSILAPWLNILKNGRDKARNLLQLHSIVCTVFDDNRASYFIYKMTSLHNKHSLFTYELAKHLCSRIENQQTQMDNSSKPLTDSDAANTALRAAPKTNACKNKKLLV